jgi:extracellular matrix regulatory protein A
MRSSIVDIINVGYGNVVPANRIVAVLQPSSAPIKRLKEEAAEKGRLVDATQGRRTRAVLLLDSEHIVLSAVQVQTLSLRLAGEEETKKSVEQD